MKRVYFLILFFLTVTLLGQTKVNNEHTRYSLTSGFSFGYKYQGSSYGECNLLLAHLVNSRKRGSFMYADVGLGTDFNFNSQQFILGPKISCESNFLMYAARINLTSYTNFKKVDLRLTPEFGLSWLGFATIYYGYNFRLNSNEFKLVSNHQISLLFNVIPKYKKGFYNN